MKVLISDKVAPEGVQMLKDAGLEVDLKTGLPEEELVKIIPEYDALIVRSETKVTQPIIQAAKKLKIIARAGVGVDNVNLEEATKKGIVVVNSPEGNTLAAAEHTIAMLLALSRNIPQAQVSLKEGKWERGKFVGVEVYGKTLGILGLGKIGSRVAAVAQAMGMKVIANDPFVSKEYADKLGVELKDLNEVLKEADYLTLHIPKTKETTHLIDKKKIAAMKKGVRIVNCARGGIIDEEALYEALKSGQVGGAALDVFEKEPPTGSPLLELSNVVVAPHLGASTVEAQVNVVLDVADQIIHFLKGEPARAAVNIPSMRPEILAPIKSYMPLAEKLGKLVSQITGGAIKSIEVSYFGEVAQFNVEPLTIAVVKGVLEPVITEGVNFVNAPIIAKERGIKVVESKSDEVRDFANLISVKVQSENRQRSAAGALFGTYGERLVSIDGFRIDAVPAGYLLICSNIDKPGVIGRIGTFLGSHNINIAGMDVGREFIGGKAVMILNVDILVPDELVRELSKLEGISEATLVKL